MESIRKWFYRPKRDDTSLLAQFFYADESLSAVACELDSFDGRQEPERCSTLVNQLRHCQDKVLTICNQIMDDLIPESRANRDFRVKFPDDVMQENLAGQLWFGAECLAAGSSIMNREAESSAMRPLAKALTKSLENVRNLLREHALKGHMNLKTQNPLEPYLEKLIESLKIFDRLFADFELCYVGAMVPVKSTKEYEQQELVCVLFSETLQRALERGLLSQADVDNYEPALMFTIPRLAIVSGLLAPPGGPLCLNSPDSISAMFRPFRTLLLKIKELLWTLNNRELHMLEKLLCSNEDLSSSMTQSNKSTCQDIPDLEEFVHNFYTGYPNCKDFIIDFYTVTKNTGTNMDEVANDVIEGLDGVHKTSEETEKEVVEKEVDSENVGISTEEFINIVISSSSSSSSSSGDDSNNITSKSNDDNSSNSSDTQIQSKIEYNCKSEKPSCDPNICSNDSDSMLSSTRNNTEESVIPNIEKEENYMTSDISQILGDTENIEIPQTQYLLNQVSHENTVTVGEPVHTQNSLPDLDSKKLISEANKTLSNLLLEGECQNEISEQTDSGICTVISSENTSLYDKSPEEKKTFANEIPQSERITLDGEDVQENTSYSCSNFNSPKNKNSLVLENACVCNMRSVKNVDNPIEVANLNGTETVEKHIPRISTNFDGTHEEFVGLAYGTGHLPVCDSNHSSFQINYSENWENLNLNIDASTSSKEFWKDLKCENCPSTSKSINRMGNKIEKSCQDKVMAKKARYERSRKLHHQRKHDRSHYKINADGSTSRNVQHIRTVMSNESSRSNSIDRCLNPRLTNFGASLHPSSNTRQMPNFGSHSPHASPRLQHFESRPPIGLRNYCVSSRMYKNSSPQNRKLLDHRRSRSEQMARLKKKESDRRDKCNNKIHGRLEGKKKLNNKSLINDTINDGLGPRTEKSGLAVSEDNSKDDVVNPSMSSVTRSEVGSSSSGSSFYDSSSETSEFQSDCQDDEEIALAMQAAEIANRNQIRAKFRSSEDLVHRLFVCIAGVADQLQTNFASDLRNILKCVFLMNSSQVVEEDEVKVETNIVSTIQSICITNDVDQSNRDCDEHGAPQDYENETRDNNSTIEQMTERGEECVERAPAWVPDTDAPRCMACQSGFTVVRRRHHCRNCGKVFCGRCSSNNVPLPRYGHTKPVRVCNRCFLYQVTPFTVSHVTSTS